MRRIDSLRAGLIGVSALLTGVTGWTALGGADSLAVAAAHLLSVVAAVGLGVAAWLSLRAEEPDPDPVTTVPAFGGATALAAIADTTTGPVLWLVVAAATVGLAGTTGIVVSAVR